jgi:hypothetical protein
MFFHVFLREIGPSRMSLEINQEPLLDKKKLSQYLLSKFHKSQSPSHCTILPNPNECDQNHSRSCIYHQLWKCGRSMRTVGNETRSDEIPGKKGLLVKQSKPSVHHRRILIFLRHTAFGLVIAYWWLVLPIQSVRLRRSSHRTINCHS